MQPDVGTPSDVVYRQRLITDTRSPNTVSKIHPYFRPYLGVNTGKGPASPGTPYSWPAGTEVQYRVMAAESSVSNSPRDHNQSISTARHHHRPSPECTKHSSPMNPTSHMNGGYCSSGAGSMNTEAGGSVVQYPLDSRLRAALLSHFIVGIPALFMTVLSVQLLFNMHAYASNLPTVPANSWSRIMQDTSLVLCSITLAFSSAAFFTAFLQLFLSIKAIKLHPESQLRILRYLRGGMFLRFISFVGFFLSIPMYLISLLLSLQSVRIVDGSSAVSSVFVIVGAGGILLIISTIAHSVYSWLWGHIAHTSDKHHALPNLDNNLSTLV